MTTREIRELESNKGYQNVHEGLDHQSVDPLISAVLTGDCTHMNGSVRMSPSETRPVRVAHSIGAINSMFA